MKLYYDIDVRFQLANPIAAWIFRRRIRKLMLRWNADCDSHNAQIKLEAAGDEHASFKWSHLLWQETREWCRQGKRVSQEEFNWMCNRRGFSCAAQKVLISYLDCVGLQKGLVPATAIKEGQP